MGLKDYSEKAMTLPEGDPLPGNVFLPPAIRGKQPRVSHDVAIVRDPPDVQENMTRIQADTDPVGLLIAIANGQPVATFVVDEQGGLKIEWETLPLDKRLSVIKYLADKILPRLSVRKKMSGKPGDGGSWEALVDNASNNK